MRQALKPTGNPDVYLDCFSDEELEQLISIAHSMPDRIDAQLPPSTRKQMLGILADFADFLQVGVPEEAGINMYLKALEDVPYQFLEAAKDRLAKVHKFARLPLPADFRKHIDEDLERIEALKRSWSTTITRLNNTQHRRKQRG